MSSLKRTRLTPPFFARLEDLDVDGPALLDDSVHALFVASAPRSALDDGRVGEPELASLVVGKPGLGLEMWVELLLPDRTQAGRTPRIARANARATLAFADLGPDNVLAVHVAVDVPKLEPRTRLEMRTEQTAGR